MKVLLIDDEPDNIDLLRFVLEGAGHAVVPAVTAEEALAMETQDDFDIILTDLSLPGDVDGFELIRRLRADGRNARTPLVAVTAFSDAEIHARAMSAGCDRTVTKPILGLLTFVREMEELVGAHQR